MQFGTTTIPLNPVLAGWYLVHQGSLYVHPMSQSEQSLDPALQMRSDSSFSYFLFIQTDLSQSFAIARSTGCTSKKVGFDGSPLKVHGKFVQAQTNRCQSIQQGECKVRQNFQSSISQIYFKNMRSIVQILKAKVEIFCCSSNATSKNILYHQYILSRKYLYSTGM